MHAWNLEEVSEQAKTDPTTLKEFYLGGITDRIKAKAQGIEVKTEKWSDLIEKLDIVYRRRYQQIKK